MTITVRSNDPTPAAAATTGTLAGAAVTETKSAPEAQASGETASESDTGETEASGETQDDSEGSEGSDEGTEGSTEEAGKPKKKGGFQRRIDKLNTRVSAAQQEVEYWKQQALKGAGEAKPQSKVEPKPAGIDGKPDPNNFDTHAEWVEKMMDWKSDQARKADSEAKEKSRLEDSYNTAVKTHADRVAAFAKTNTDFNDVIQNIIDITPSPTVEWELINSENGPELVYALAKNPEEFERINKLSPVAAARAIGRLEASLTASTSETKEAKKTTNAPKPIAPVGKSGASVAKSLDDPNLSQAEYERLRRDQTKRKYG